MKVKLHMDLAKSFKYPMQITVIAWLAVMFIICARSALTPQRNSVVGIYRQAADNWLHRQPMYEADADQDRFRYSPLTAALLTPLRFFSEQTANVLWRLLNAGVFVAGCCWWLRELCGASAMPRGGGFLPPGQARRLAGAPLFLSLILPFAVPSLNNGQINPLMIGLILASVAAVRKEWFLLAGAILALACWIKVYPLAIALLLVLLYPRRFSLPFFFFTITGFAAPFLFQSPTFVISQYGEWLNYLRTDDRQLLAAADSLRDVRLLFRVWLAPLSAEVFLILQMTVAASVAGFCLWQRRTNASENQLLLSTTHLGCCWMTVFGPSTESATWILLAPSLVFLLLKTWQNREAVWVRLVPAGSYAVFLLTYAAMWFPWGKHFAALGPQPLAGLVVFGFAFRTGRELLCARDSIDSRAGGFIPPDQVRRLAATCQSNCGRISARYRTASLSTRLFLHLRRLQTPYESIAARLPAKGLILDLGCGHGLLSVTLALQSPARRVTGIDHDDRRIQVAKEAGKDLENVEFTRGDFSVCILPTAEKLAGIVILDALHYLDQPAQETLLYKLYKRLADGGVLLIREVDTKNGVFSWCNRRHEFVMTGLGFTQANKLHFRQPNEWMTLLGEIGFDVESERCRFFPFADRFFFCRKSPLAGLQITAARSLSVAGPTTKAPLEQSIHARRQKSSPAPDPNAAETAAVSSHRLDR